MGGSLPVWWLWLSDWWGWSSYSSECLSLHVLVGVEVGVVPFYGVYQVYSRREQRVANLNTFEHTLDCLNKDGRRKYGGNQSTAGSYGGVF